MTTPQAGDGAELVPGRETDARVALALGWTDIDPGRCLLSDWTGATPDGLRKRLPHYSTDEGDALRALMAFEMWTLRGHGDGGKSCAVWPEAERGWVRVEHADLCLAVCSAVLAAKGQTDAG